MRGWLEDEQVTRARVAQFLSAARTKVGSGAWFEDDGIRRNLYPGRARRVQSLADAAVRWALRVLEEQKRVESRTLAGRKQWRAVVEHGVLPKEGG